MNHPAVLMLALVAGIYLGRLWFQDRVRGQTGTPGNQPLPGATPAPARLVFMAMAGCLGLLTIETAGEHWLGVANQQSTMTWLAAAYSIASAPIIEEILFRGWLVIDDRGRRIMWLAAIGASVVFALLHPFLWRWDDAGFALTLNVKGWFSATIVFATSLWLYALRLGSWNPQRSLLPCFAGHAAKNLGVVAVKAAAGFMGGLW
jgi:membrane protease YdiL (CAAX protease family)